MSGLLESGIKRIEWARANMPILAGIRDRFTNELPFRGLKIGICLHLEAKTAVWLETLHAGGATITATGSPGTTRNDVVSVLNMCPEITALGMRTDNFTTHLEHCREILRSRPNLLADNGGDLHKLLLSEPEFKSIRQNIIGATEETTTGGFRLRDALHSFDFPTWVINDTDAKRLIENRYGVGSSVVEGVLRATNLMLHGKRVLVVGYGYCGSGVAMRLRGMGAIVLIADNNPIRQLEAHMEGFITGELNYLLPVSDVVITVTGRDNILGPTEIAMLPHG